jgi:3-oxoacyl-[acyl-carrier-protein] synthase III
VRRYAQVKRDAYLNRVCGPAQVERSANALVVSTENITLNWYPGDDRSMLIPNTLFRMGCAAVVLTNRPAARRRAKYELRHITRVHLGADETAYRCRFHPSAPSDPIPYLALEV